MVTSDTQPLVLAALAGGVVALAVAATAFLVRSGAEQEWLFATRWTARTSLLLFAASYVAIGHAARRGFGLAFAAAHLVHAGLFLIYIVTFDIKRSLVSTVGGTIGYLVLGGLVAATFVPVRGAPVLRRWGMVYLWLVFAVSYLGRVVEGGTRTGEGWFGLLVLLAIPAVRLGSRRRLGVAVKAIR